MAEVGFKHDVVIDTRGDIAVIFDCQEEYAVPLSLKTLQACIGAKDKLRCIIDVRRIVIHSALGKRSRYENKFVTMWH